MTSRAKLFTTVVAPTIAALVVLVFWFEIGTGVPGTRDWYEVKALVGSAGSLSPNANVTIAGMPVGHVASVERAGHGARIALRLEKRHGPIPVDSRFAIRSRTLVGENYIALYPGKSQESLPSGGALPPGRAIQQVDLDEILDALRGKTRERARDIVRSLGSSTGTRGIKLNRTLEHATGVVTRSAPIMRVVARDHRRVERLVDEVGRLTSAVGARSASLRALAGGARTTFTAIASRDAALADVLERFPPTMREVRSTTAVLRNVTRSATPVVNKLAGVVGDLSPAVRNLQPATTEGRAVLASLEKAAPGLEQTLARLRRVAPRATLALPAVRATMCQLAPALKYLSPYAKDLATLLQDMGSSTNFYDATGHAARLYVTAGENSLGRLAPDTQALARKMLQSGLLGKSYRVAYNPFPKPGAADEKAPPDGPGSFSEVKTKYPRVQPAC